LAVFPWEQSKKKKPGDGFAQLKALAQKHNG